MNQCFLRCGRYCYKDYLFCKKSFTGQSINMGNLYDEVKEWEVIICDDCQKPIAQIIKREREMSIGPTLCPKCFLKDYPVV